ncbi:MAG: hypothetical protein ACKVIX_07160, partial [Sphingomonadales bacterium]
VNVSILKAQSISNAPELIQLATTIVPEKSPNATLIKAVIDKSAETTKNPEVINWDALTPIERPNKPVIKKPRRGKNTIN